MKLSDDLKSEKKYVENKLKDLPEICTRCHCDLNSYAKKCSAELSDACPGFIMIEKTKTAFRRDQ